MPISLRPNAKLPVVLECDRNEPPESRPTFYVRALTMEAALEMGTRMDEAMDHKEDTVLYDANVTLLMDYLLGWQNMGTFEFGNCNMREVLAFSEVRELMRKILANAHVQSEEKKS